ncbi:nucleotidyltransferase domain-containing protein [Frankia sp. QA3]|uniref:nucleotidyltransferase domain-containing protein n=1 Tax=Frankia sp. QA3 TaxID=710111 RepID=UPI000269BD17|nr:nucleotidyltransferase domain-containing protein [Frankia sp. QA3]EIV91354.1 nucleotidyltransferase family protein [Frankia sp. QA3]
MNDGRFLAEVAETLAGLPTVEAVTLGGSRAQGAHRPDSDWDLAIYYRGDFDPQCLRDLGYDGEVSEVGGWGGGVFNGGAWLRIAGRPVDVHYRDLDVVEEQLAKAERGEFHSEPLMFHLAGIPSYLVVGELAINRVLVGSLPRPGYPEALRLSAPRIWSDRAALTLSYAEHNHAPHGRAAQCAGLLALAASDYAHAVLAARGAGVTNEKRLLDRGGMRGVDDIIAGLTGQTGVLTEAVTAVRELGITALRANAGEHRFDIGRGLAYR